MLPVTWIFEAGRSVTLVRDSSGDADHQVDLTSANVPRRFVNDHTSAWLAMPPEPRAGAGLVGDAAWPRVGAGRFGRSGILKAAAVLTGTPCER